VGGQHENRGRGTGRTPLCLWPRSSHACALRPRPVARSSICTNSIVADHRHLRAGDVAEFRLRFDDDLIEAGPPTQVGQSPTAELEGTIVSLAPFVVSSEGLALTITVPTGVTLPGGLATGQRIELTMHVGSGNVFTLVAVDELENARVDVNGFVVSSTATQLVLNANGTMFTFSARAGTTLPVLANGTLVEARGVRQNGTITLERLRVEDNRDGDGDDSGDGGHDGGGHH
jgi:hypothetical protein